MQNKSRDKIEGNVLLSNDKYKLSSPDDLEKKYWDWLDDKYSKKLRQIRTSVAKHISNLEKNFPQLAGYTPHGPGHLKRVENIIHRLIPGNSVENLTVKERFYLLTGAWVHDLGMLRGLFGDVEKKDLITYSDDKIRSEHHLRSERFIVNHFSQVDVDEEDVNVLGILSRYHRRSVNIQSCPKELFVNNESIRVRLLAAYLRLADSLDIDQSRTPSSDYAICISYNIPASSKLHWIKSRIVSGISIKAIDQKIVINFKDPQESELIAGVSRNDITWNDFRTIKNNLIGLRKIIIEDLVEELNSVKNILIRGGITYFLDVEQCVSQVAIDDHVFKELIHLANNFDLIAHPSASRMMMMVLETFERILGSFILTDNTSSCNKCPNDFDKSLKNSCDDQIKSIRKKLNEFLDELECQIIQHRSCHIGLKNLTHRLRKMIESKDIKAIIDNLKKEKNIINKERSDIRRIAKKYFSSFLTTDGFTQPNNNTMTNAPIDFLNHIDKSMLVTKFSAFIKNAIQRYKKEDYTPENTDNRESVKILVYGYSELVIKAICGFRDCLIDIILSTYSTLADSGLKLHKIDIEKLASSFFRIYVCEGQPKTITAPNDALAYHDGSRYAIALARRKFTRIIMLPDLSVGSLFERTVNSLNNGINLVMIGANGLEFVKRSDSGNIDYENEPLNFFRHSSGHLALSALTTYFKAKGDNSMNFQEFPRLLLVLGTSKCEEVKLEDARKAASDCHGDYSTCKITKKDQFYFWSHCENENVRNEPFIVRDKTIRKEFEENNICLYNPREDRIQLRTVDDLIMDFAFFNDIRNDHPKRRITVVENLIAQLNSFKISEYDTSK